MYMASLAYRALSVQYGSATEGSPATTHDISRVSYHVKHIESFAQALQDVSQRDSGLESHRPNLMFDEVGQ
jgi:hypothetical protein